MRDFEPRRLFIDTGLDFRAGMFSRAPRGRVATEVIEDVRQGLAEDDKPNGKEDFTRSVFDPYMVSPITVE